PDVDRGRVAPVGRLGHDLDPRSRPETGDGVVGRPVVDEEHPGTETTERSVERPEEPVEVRRAVERHDDDRDVDHVPSASASDGMAATGPSSTGPVAADGGPADAGADGAGRRRARRTLRPMTWTVSTITARSLPNDQLST